jgi:hypothetical protein
VLTQNGSPHSLRKTGHALHLKDSVELPRILTFFRSSMTVLRKRLVCEEMAGSNGALIMLTIVANSAFPSPFFAYAYFCFSDFAFSPEAASDIPSVEIVLCGETGFSVSGNPLLGTKSRIPISGLFRARGTHTLKLSLTTLFSITIQ